MEHGAYRLRTAWHALALTPPVFRASPAADCSLSGTELVEETVKGDWSVKYSTAGIHHYKCSGERPRPCMQTAPPGQPSVRTRLPAAPCLLCNVDLTCTDTPVDASRQSPHRAPLHFRKWPWPYMQRHGNNGTARHGFCSAWSKNQRHDQPLFIHCT